MINNVERIILIAKLQLKLQYQSQVNLFTSMSIYFLKELIELETHWIPFYVNDNNVSCFDSFGVEHIPKEI